MPFNSIVFILYFLPFVLVGNILLCLVPSRIPFRLSFLVLASFIFYFWSIGFSSLILIACGLLCYLLQLLFVRKNQLTKTLLVMGIVFLIGVLAYYKYNVPVLAELRIPTLFHQFSWLEFLIKPRALLLGISFFTFQAISYLVEAYKSKSRFSFLESLSYFVFFPKLLQGPITRFSEIQPTLNHPKITVEGMFNGWVRFSFGLGKKVILADGLGAIPNAIFALPPTHFSPMIAWLGILAYTFQIFLDFSGYTDMAIGIAQMLGIFLPENFTSPYTASSISEFWNRWHITLSYWLRDCVYIQLGGSRKGEVRSILNVLVVFTLSGLWHGSGFQYLVWGIYHGIFVSLDRIMHLQNIKLRSWVAIPATFLIILIGWVFFRSPGLPYAFKYLIALAFLNQSWTVPLQVSILLNNRLFCFSLLSLWVVFFSHRVNLYKLNGVFSIVLKTVLSLSVFIYALSILATASFSPFLYFQY